MKILLLGPSGQLGRALAHSLQPLGQVVACDRACADLAEPARAVAVLRRVAPQLVVNAAAYTSVDRAESERAQAMVVNGEAPGVLAAAARAAGALFVHYSTDHVFDGSGRMPRGEQAPTAPVNAYGRSKLAGEQAVARAGGDWLLLRTSWVYAAHGDNFVTAILRQAAGQSVLTVVDDQVGAPTPAAWLAEASASLIGQALATRVQGRFVSELLHLCAGGEISRHALAQTVVDGWRARVGTARLQVQEVRPVPSSAYRSMAARPLNSRLDCSRVRERFGLQLPDWRLGLDQVLDELAAAQGIEPPAPGGNPPGAVPGVVPGRARD